MKRTIFTALAVLGIWCGIGTNFALAQFGTIGTQRTNPFVAPGTTWQGNFNTYGIVSPVRPGMNLQVVQPVSPDGTLLGAGAVATTGVLQTGGTVTFMDYRHYFPLSVQSSTTGATGSIGTQGGGPQGFGTGRNIPVGFLNTGTGSNFLRR